VWQVLAALHTKGYRSMTVQHGRGPPPQCCPAHDNTDADAPSSSGRAAPASRKGGKGTATLHVEAFPFTPSLDTQMKKAHLVVSHAGSGSVFEALKLRKRLVVVVNDALMDNHQVQHTLYPSLWCVESHPSPVVFGARCRIDRRGGYTRTSGDVTLAAPSQRSRLQTLADIGIGGGRRRRS